MVASGVEDLTRKGASTQNKEHLEAPYLHQIAAPCIGWIKINFDIATRPGFSIVGVCKNDFKKVNFADSSMVASTSDKTLSLVKFMMPS
ncbi:hypothetical protein CFP56_018710 [Quercus suber]|uniref:Uncharacterized protein n=1 Tax=Quercus suber TaxID=58331 RepID=A0AAW0KL55_QUESU